MVSFLGFNHYSNVCAGSLTSCCSCALPQAASRCICRSKRHSWSGRRHCFCRSTEYHATHDIRLDSRCSDRKLPLFPSRARVRLADHFAARTDQALPTPNMVQLRRDHHPLRLCFIPVRLARPREGHSPCHHSFQLDRPQRPPTPGSFPPARRSRPRQPIPSALHGLRVPREGSIHDLLAHRLPARLRPLGTSVSGLSIIHTWQ
jgi:hypothetical protein